MVFGPFSNSGTCLDEARIAILAGDRRGIERFVTLAGPTVLRVVRRMLGTHHPEVEDVAQEALFASLDALPRFRGECSMAHFVWRVAVLTSMNARRRLRLREKISADLACPDEVATSEESPLQHTLAHRRREALRLLLDQVPEAQAEVLALYCVLGYTTAEIAETTRVPLNTVKSRLNAAKAHVRVHLDQDPELMDLLRGVS